ncbi:MAG: prolipoprotein diacylglyceryl transferase family protein [Actinomycetota bacterium]
MFPTLFEVGGVPVDTHATFIALGVLAAAILLAHQARRHDKLDRKLLLIALGALVGAAVTSRIGSGVRYFATTPEPTATGLFLEAGRSLLGGLVGAYVGVEVTKRLVGVTESTGDLFAPGVALGLAIGRVGCFLTEQLGTPTAAPWGMTMNQTGVKRGLLCLDCGQCPTCTASTSFHPSFLYEIGFHALAFAVLWRKRDDERWQGRLLARYLVAYAAFRFLVEFVRGNVQFLFGMSGSQIFIICTTLTVLLLRIFSDQLPTLRAVASTQHTGSHR